MTLNEIARNIRKSIAQGMEAYGRSGGLGATAGNFPANDERRPAVKPIEKPAEKQLVTVSK